MSVLIILNDAPYGAERSYNAPPGDRTPEEAQGGDGDGLPHGRRGRLRQARPEYPKRYHNIERMLRRVTAAKGAIKLCGTCIDARGLAGGELIEDAAQGSMDELASLTLSAHKVVVC